MLIGIEVIGTSRQEKTNHPHIKLIINEEVYYLYSSGRIDCDYDKCGEWHQGGHDLYDLFKAALEE